MIWVTKTLIILFSALRIEATVISLWLKRAAGVLLWLPRSAIVPLVPAPAT